MAKNTYQLSLLLIGTLLVSACAQMQAPTTQSVSLRNDPGVITPLPPGRKNAPLTAPNLTMNASSGPLTGYGAPVMNTNPSVFITPGIPMQNGGMVMPSDNSVTIFPVDGTMAAGIPQSGQQFGMGQNTSFGAVNNMAPSNNRIFFKDGSSRLGSVDRQRIRSAAQQAQFVPIVSVEGYASRPTQAGSNTVESHVLNLKQSMNRSYAVARQLMRDGVPGQKVKAVSWGSAQATGDNNFDRRVDIKSGAAY